MKDYLVAIGLLVIAVLSWLWVVTAQAQTISNNTAIKGCLAIHGYHPKDFDTFNFNKASSCYHNLSLIHI